MENLTKAALINLLLKNPIAFTPQDFEALVSDDINLSFEDLREMIKHIFDVNESTLLEESETKSGLLFRLNKKSTKYRQKQYFKKVRQGFNDKNKVSNSNNKIIVAEGDSWFQFPFFIDDIIDGLNKNPTYNIYSIASAGDWFTNIIYEGKYIEELSIHTPDVFLISGGGNDFAAANRLAIMVSSKQQTAKYNDTFFEQMQLDKDYEESLRQGQQHVTKAFHAFMLTIKAQYWILFKGFLKTGRLKNMQVITQGYDNVIPSYAKFRSSPLQWIINSINGSGKWLKQPLMIKGITEETLERNIMKFLIFEFNQMFIELANHFENVYHIDCRGTATGFEDWFDELHLHSHRFKDIAKAYEVCISNNPSNKKVIRVVDIRNGKF